MARFTNKSLTNKPAIDKGTFHPASGESPQSLKHFSNYLWVLFFAAMVIATLMLSSCGGASSSSDSQQSSALSGNWQFTMAPQTDGVPGDPTFNGGLLGGFFLSSNGSITGQTVYSVTSSTSTNGPCSGGAASASITTNGQNVTITEVAGSQTYTLTGTLSADGSSMSGTYNSTAGTAVNGSACGYAETGSSWSAVSVPPLTGSITGSFHSGGGTANNSGLVNQDFPVTGTLTQGPNIGASNASVTGTLSFIDPTTGASDYPCFPGGSVSVNGGISGNTVVLQLIGTDGSTDGQIGVSPSQINFNGDNIYPVTFNSTANGYVLQSTNGLAYVVNTKSCPSGVNDAGAEDIGFICLAVNGTTTACQEPITLTPSTLAFQSQTLGADQRQRQEITLTNNSGSSLTGLTINFIYDSSGSPFGGYTDFNNLPSFTETDTCGTNGASSQGQPFNLNAGQSCSIEVSFSPQEACPWLPFGNPSTIQGAPPVSCPFPQSAIVTVNSPTTADNDKSFAVSVKGTGVSAIQPLTPELDFSAEEQFAPPEASLPQLLSFTNTSTYPVQILGHQACTNPPTVGAFLTLPAPRQSPTGGQQPVSGLQVVCNGGGCTAANTSISVAVGYTSPPTITYNCDSDSGSKLPNFQISSDTCSGATLAPQEGCSVQVTYAPQPDTVIPSGGLDFFLELNTLQCWPAGTTPSDSNPCEIDSGRFPVELKANGPSTLRMSPSASLDFAPQKKGTTSAPLTITLTNDGTLATPQPIDFVGSIVVSGNYSIPAGGNSCPAVLAPGAPSCTVSVVFTPQSVGLNKGQLTINYQPQTNGSFQQFVYLRGIGQ
ncbi:MAG: choice-of-anchor D domain-containing protein [Terriglobales bacterium]